jgi:rod shape-determining protein MreB and related proteins
VSPGALIRGNPAAWSAVQVVGAVAEAILGVIGRLIERADTGGTHKSRLPSEVPAVMSGPSPYHGPVPRDLAIDLGTANTLVYAKGRGIILNEPTVIAYNTRTRDVLAIGADAWEMIGRTPGYIVAVRPLRQGAITDFDITERMLRVLLQRCGVSRLTRPRVLICVPSAITRVERRAVQEAARHAGASATYLIEQPIAAAIGAGLAIHEPMGSMVVDVGGGTAESAVISLGGVVSGRAIRCGGFDFDTAIQAYVRHHHGVAIGERTAEAVKFAIGSAYTYQGEQSAQVRGREVSTGMPQTITLTPLDIRSAVDDHVTQIVDAATACLSDTPPELAQDIMFDGIHLLGGGALLRGIAQRLANATSVPVNLVDLPLECVVLGAGQCLEALEELRSVFTDRDD